MNQEINGACLCGKVKYAVTGPFDQFHICHCSQCRRSTGSAHASNIFTRKDRLRWISGEELTKRYDPEEPGVISKAFCTHCGSWQLPRPNSWSLMWRGHSTRRPRNGSTVPRRCGKPPVLSWRIPRRLSPQVCTGCRSLSTRRRRTGFPPA